MSLTIFAAQDGNTEKVLTVLSCRPRTLRSVLGETAKSMTSSLLIESAQWVIKRPSQKSRTTVRDQFGGLNQMARPPSHLQRQRHPCGHGER
jgi:hypothetical protein